MATSNSQTVQTALLALQHRGGTFPASLFSPMFRVRSCGTRMDLEGLRMTWQERQGLIREVGLKVVDTIARADQVAVVRRGMVRAADGSQTQLCVVDVWRLEGGLIVEGEQCWNRLPGPAADDMPLTAKEGANAESVRLALASLQDLRGVQASLQQHWAPGFQGRVNGLALDLDGLCRHWSELQAKLSTVLVQVEELVAQGSGVGVVYRLLAGKRDIFRSRSFSRSLSRGGSATSLGSAGGGGAANAGSAAGGGGEAGAAGEAPTAAASGSAELRVIAVFHLDSEGRIDRSAAVCELVSGHSGDEALATAMPPAEE